MNGDTMGFGFELSMAADLRIAQRGDYRIGLPRGAARADPRGLGAHAPHQARGAGRALDLILRAQVVTPDRALELGLVTELADDALEAALGIADELAGMPAIAVAMAKKAIHQGADLPLDLALALEAESSFRLKQSPDIVHPMREYLALPLDERRAWLDGG